MIRTSIALFITLALAGAASAAPPAASPTGEKSVAQQEKPATRDKAPSQQQPAAEEAKPDSWTWFGMGFESRRARMGDDDFHMAPRAGGSAFGSHSAGGSANGR